MQRRCRNASALPSQPSSGGKHSACCRSTSRRARSRPSHQRRSRPHAPARSPVVAAVAPGRNSSNCPVPAAAGSGSAGWWLEPSTYSMSSRAAVSSARTAMTPGSDRRWAVRAWLVDSQHGPWPALRPRITVWPGRDGGPPSIIQPTRLRPERLRTDHGSGMGFRSTRSADGAVRSVVKGFPESRPGRAEQISCARPLAMPA